MATIQINHPFTMPHQELREGLDKLVSRLVEQFQLDCEWDSEDSLCFSRTGADGRVAIGEDEIELTVNLGMLMSAFRTTIEREIRDFIDEHIY